MSHKIVVIVIFVWFTTVYAGLGWAAILLQDDFNDNSLDPTKWTTNTAASGSNVVEQNQRIELTQRGLLITAQQYDPLAVGPMTITGRWTFLVSNQAGDILDVITRTDASNLSSVGFPQSGISFQYNDNNATPSINISRVGVGSFTSLASAPIKFFPNDVFDFTITDDGTNLAFSVVQVGGAGKSASISGTDSTDFSTDNVIFTNSRLTGAYVAYLDNVQISSTLVPEPATFFIWSILGVSCIGVTYWRRRKNTDVLA